MLDQNYLTLQLVRLKSPSEWTCKGSGLSFILLKGGAGNYLSRSAAFRLSPDAVMVLSGEAGGKVCPSRAGEIVFCSFSTCLEHLFPLFAGSEISLLQNVTEALRTPKFYPPTHPVALECHRLAREIPPQFDLHHRAQLLRVAAVVLTEEFKTSHHQQVGFVRMEDHLLRVFEGLSSDELLNLSVGQLAERFGCSRRHLNRLFHHYFGSSVAALRMEMRLLKAVLLLRDPDAKVINVAEKCGFNHLGLFNICFKRRFGASPGQWRKLSSQGDSRLLRLTGDGSGCPLHSNGLCPWHSPPQDHFPEALNTFSPKTQASAKAVTDPTTLPAEVGQQSLGIHEQAQAQPFKKKPSNIRA